MTARPKGFIDGWSNAAGVPPPHILETIENVKEVLREYSSYGKMTIRQIFYRLVAQYGFEKTDRSYQNLVGWLTLARRAQLIPFNAIRDDSGRHSSNTGHDGRDDIWDMMVYDIEHAVDHYRLDRQIGQPQHIILYCETEGMVPMLGQMVRDYNVPVTSPKGFSSVTVTHNVAQRIADREKPTVFMHVGDHDPSGESIFTSMSQDIGKFVAEIQGGRYNPTTGATIEVAGWEEGTGPLFKPMRVALTEEQVEEFNLPTAPAKRSDSRSANWDKETTQLEAMDPPLLERVVTEVIGDMTDYDALADLEAREHVDKDKLRATIESENLIEILREAAKVDAAKDEEE